MTQIVLFVFFGLIACITAVLVVSKRNPVISALFLILNFSSLAGLYLLLYAQFIAVVQIIVYAGAIMVLFLFVIMLLRPAHEKRFFEGNKFFKLAALSLGVLLFIQFSVLLFKGAAENSMLIDSQKSQEIGTIQFIGHELFTKYLLPFEAVGFLLLAAAIGAIILAKREKVIK
jgi:NADH-quinone oxidoreductase subunit J